MGKMSMGLIFFDYSGIPQNCDLHPKVHHFRSSSNPSITKDLDEQWSGLMMKMI